MTKTDQRPEARQIIAFYQEQIGKEFQDIREELVHISLTAGKQIREAYKTPQERIAKGRTDYSTRTDILVEETITSNIKKKFPSHGIIGEESGGDTHAEYNWIIDPIDGTFNFSFGLSFFAVSIAVVKGGKVILGAVYDPVQDELFFAQEGHGAFLWEERLKVTGTEKLLESVICSDLSYDPILATQNMEDMKKLMPLVRTQRLLGSAALALAYLGSGRIDGFFHRDLYIWDIAAGMLLVTEAGGKITDFQGQENDLTRHNKQQVLASNGGLHGKLMGNLGDH